VFRSKFETSQTPTQSYQLILHPNHPTDHFSLPSILSIVYPLSQNHLSTTPEPRLNLLTIPLHGESKSAALSRNALRTSRHADDCGPAARSAALEGRAAVDAVPGALVGAGRTDGVGRARPAVGVARAGAGAGARAGGRGRGSDLGRGRGRGRDSSGGDQGSRGRGRGVVLDDGGGHGLLNDLAGGAGGDSHEDAARQASRGRGRGRGRGRVRDGSRGGSRSAAVALGLAEVAGVDDDVRAGVGILDVDTLGDDAAVADVSDEDGRTGGEGDRSPLGLLLGLLLDRLGDDRDIALGGAAADADGSAVHILLAVADLVVPGPGPDGDTLGSIVRDVVLVELGVGAVADDGVDDSEGLAAVVAQADLARAAAMGSRALDGEVDAGTRGPSVDDLASSSAHVDMVALAGVVGAVGGEGSGVRVVDVRGELVELGAERRRVADLHVGRGQLGAGEKGDKSAGGEDVGEHFCLFDSFFFFGSRALRAG